MFKIFIEAVLVVVFLIVVQGEHVQEEDQVLSNQIDQAFIFFIMPIKFKKSLTFQIKEFTLA